MILHLLDWLLIGGCFGVLYVLVWAVDHFLPEQFFSQQPDPVNEDRARQVFEAIQQHSFKQPAAKGFKREPVIYINGQPYRESELQQFGGKDVA